MMIHKFNWPYTDITLFSNHIEYIAAFWGNQISFMNHTFFIDKEELI